MKNSNNKNLIQRHHILQFAAEGLCDAVILIAELPSELHVDAILSCKRWLTMLKRDFAQFEREFMRGAQHGKK